MYGYGIQERFRAAGIVMTKILLLCVRCCAGSFQLIFLSNPVNICMFLQIRKLKQEMLCNLSKLISGIGGI